MTKTKKNAIIKQITPILASAVAAALLAFMQSLAVQQGLCPTPEINPEIAGIAGAMIKGAHSITKIMS
jgi:hypothetical protein